MYELSTLEKIVAVFILILVSILLFTHVFPEQADNLDPTVAFSLRLVVFLLSTISLIFIGVRVLESVFIEFPESEGHKEEREEYIRNMVVGIIGGIVVLLFDKLESIAPSEFLSLETVVFIFPSVTFFLASIIVISAGFLLYIVIQTD
jgi:hypothetical protein